MKCIFIMSSKPLRRLTLAKVSYSINKLQWVGQDPYIATGSRIWWMYSAGQTQPCCLTLLIYTLVNKRLCHTWRSPCRCTWPTAVTHSYATCGQLSLFTWSHMVSAHLAGGSRVSQGIPGKPRESLHWRHAHFFFNPLMQTSHQQRNIC